MNRASDFLLLETASDKGEKLEHHLDGEVLWLVVPPQITQNGQIKVKLRFSYRLINQNSTLGSTQFQTNLGEWYAVIPPLSPAGEWLIHPRGSVGEFIANDPVNFSVQFLIDNSPDNLVIAASTPYEMVESRLIFEMLSSRSFAISLSPYYEKISSVGNGREFAVVFFPWHFSAAQVVLEAIENATTLYSALFGDYPYTSLTVVESLFWDGMEYQGLVFVGQEYFSEFNETSDGYLIPIVVHETAHQWWYGMVGNDPALEPWLDEALCTYSEAIYFENYIPEKLDWWWNFRVNRFQPSGWIDSTIYDHTNFRSYVDAVYLRGALWLQEIRQKLGDEQFFFALNEYAGVYAGQRASGEDFLWIIQTTNSGDIEQVIPDYFQNRSNP